MTKTKLSDSVTATEDRSTIMAVPSARSFDKLQKFVEEETKVVKGRFRNFDNPGGMEKISCRKYKNVPMFSRFMTDGEIYEIPLYVARFLNGVDVTAASVNGKINSCAYPVHGFATTKHGELPPSMLGTGAQGEPGVPVPMTQVSKWKRRFGFESLEFDTDFA